jgi:hypothetical protein
VSKKSHPGDGTHNCGTKGGALYGNHFAIAEQQQEARSFVRSVAGLVRLLRKA